MKLFYFTQIINTCSNLFGLQSQLSCTGSSTPSQKILILFRIIVVSNKSKLCKTINSFVYLRYLYIRFSEHLFVLIYVPQKFKTVDKCFTGFVKLSKKENIHSERKTKALTRKSS